MRKPLSFALIPLMSAGTALADWRDDIGWSDLQEWATLDSISIPASTSLAVGMSEAVTTVKVSEDPDVFEQGYAPDPSNSQFSDESITDVSAIPMDRYSGHANGTAIRFFGNTTSLMPSVGAVSVYEAGDFATDDLLNRATNSWSETIMAHAWVGDVGGVDNTRIVSSVLDQTTTDSGILHIVGIKNGGQNNQSELLCHNYNNISVGRSDGNHSYGEIPSGYEGAGRQKPELVCPLTTTSASTAATSSFALLLRTHAETHSSANAKLPVVIKSCMLAGANKRKFSDWDNTSSRPIDEIYGAGETDVLSSFRILNQNESSPGSVELRGWDYNTFRRNTVEYSFTVPEHATNAHLSANLSWNRAASGGSYSTLINYSLTLEEDISANGDNSSRATVFTSDSSVDNIEHIWNTELKAGKIYTLTVAKSNETNSNTSYALAWRVDIETNSSPTTFVQTATENQLGFTDLAPEHSYFLERSTDLSTWSPVSTLTSTVSGTLDYVEPNTALGEKVFYRLRYFSP
jgi:hypothetical protein